MLFVAGCSTEKNTFLNRNIHAIGTEYNVLYNGNEALKTGKESLISSYVDNYWEVLPVERMKIDDDDKLPGAGDKNPHFEKAEEKATKAIQKHGMNIEGKEYNPQMDEAYLLLGKARYYDQRFIPSLEAFNYVLYKYWTSDKVNETRIWREKVNIRLENEELALKNIKRILRLEELNSRNYADAHATMAQAYINLKYKDSALQKLKIAAAVTTNYEEKGRYYFIIGQLYNRLNLRDSANYTFDKIIELNRKTLRVYVINAHLEKLRNLNRDVTKPISDIEFLAFITALEEDYENNAFLDKIYREKAMFYARRDSLHRMEEFLNKSIRATKNDKYLNVLNYETLAQYRFDNALYKDAESYYDSTLINLEKSNRKYRIIEKKKNNLKDVVKYEDVARKTDSILHLVAMSEEEQKAYFEAYIQDLKDEEQEKDEAKQGQDQLQNSDQKSSFSDKAGKQNVFYFYNPVTLQYGRNEFKTAWGERKLEDNWRLKDKKTITEATEVVQQSKETIVEDKYDINYYLSKIPSEQEIIDSLKTERNLAYYELGVLYKEKFREYGLAVEKLETLLKNEPEKRFVLPAKYNLYKIHETLQLAQADAVKNDIITNHPDSRYAAILKNPEAILSDNEETPEILYTKLFKIFENQEYETVIAQSDQYISQFTGEPIVPKFEMLKASAIGRLQGFESYKEALNTIALNYPNEPEGKEAKKIASEKIKAFEDKAFKDSLSSSNWKLVFLLQKADKKTADKLFKTIAKSLTDLNYDHLNVSKDVYDDSRVFIVVHGFKSKDRTLGYSELLSINRKYRVKNKNFPILSDNYKIIQVHKNLENYQKEKLKS